MTGVSMIVSISAAENVVKFGPVVVEVGMANAGRNPNADNARAAVPANNSVFVNDMCFPFSQTKAVGLFGPVAHPYLPALPS